MIHIHATPTNLPTTAGGEFFTLKYFCKLTSVLFIAEASKQQSLFCSIVHRILCMSHFVWLHVFNEKQNNKRVYYGFALVSPHTHT